ncbi:hypothetical protein HYX19_01520 [Candidatus Woesearchaeota archaeon]|nr:hypothetical protein [Candidatus Woesearchaeota archaeon]
MKINPDLKSRIDHCYALAKNGATELALVGLKLSIKEFCAEPHKQSFGNPELVLQSIERTSHRIGVEIAFQHAEHFYQEGGKSAARGWLRYEKIHASPLKLDITNRISEMKDKYRDRTPLLF